MLKGAFRQLLQPQGGASNNLKVAGAELMCSVLHSLVVSLVLSIVCSTLSILFDEISTFNDLQITFIFQVSATLQSIDFSKNLLITGSDTPKNKACLYIVGC